MSSVAVNPAIHKIFPKHSADLRARLESSLPEQLSSTLLLRERAAPVTVPFGIAVLDQLSGGLPRGALTEITGPASSGRTGVMLSALAGATNRQEACALVDANDSFDPASAASAGVDLERLLWVRCNPHANSVSRKITSSRGSGFAHCGVLEQVLKVTDLLLQAGGFAMVVLDLGDIPAESVRRVPLTSWFRFRRAVEPTATVLLLIEQEACAKTCASLVLRLQGEAVRTLQSDAAVVTGLFQRFGSNECSTIPRQSAVSYATLLRGLSFRAEVVRSWAKRKPPQSVGAQVELQTAIQAF